MADLLQDLRFGVRMLRQRPLLSAAAVLSLALGIGANATIFSVVNALLFRPMGVREPERLVSLYTRDERNPGFAPLSHLNWKDYREQATTFSALAGYDWTGMSVASGEGEAELLFGQMVSGNYFPTLGVEPALGRTFTPEEDAAPGAHPVAVVSHAFWRERLAADPDVVGRRLLVNGHPFTVVGVAPASFTGTDVGVQPELWVPMAMNRVLRPNESANWYDERRGLFVNAVGRLAPGATIERARAELEGIGGRLAAAFPEDNRGRNVQLVPFGQATINPGFRGGVVAAMGMLMAVVGLVLLIACANVANLLLARASARRREIAIRLSIGAGRARLVRQLLTESLLLALCGGAGGLLLAAWGRGALLAFLPPTPLPISIGLDLPLDARVLGFTLAVSLLTGLLFGLAPALQATHPDLVSGVKDAAADPGTGRGRRVGFRDLLVAAQVALSAVALIGAGLFVRSLAAAQQIDPGYDPRPLAVVSFDVGLQGYDQPRAEQFWERALERVRAAPGVAAAAVAQAGPMQGTMTRTVFREGRESETDGRHVQVNAVGAGYFEALGVAILRGRGFLPSDRADAPKVVVVNETMAKTFWPGEESIGQRFRFFGDDYAVEVVGVARDAKYNFVGEDPQPYIYQTLSQRHYSGVTLLVKAKDDGAAPVLAQVQSELRAL
ncbi:MAG TPA: ABC transporter permease, partial [Thermoanaerobaculia bacterium]|nr:ABC transporter permease [Thermoanaerobaculia bacterium]